MKSQLLWLAALLLLFSFSSCGGYRYSSSPPQQSPSLAEPQPEIITQSLFEAKDRTLSELDIQRLLDGKIKLPDSVRIAVFNFGSPSRSLKKYYSNYWDDEEYLKTQQAFNDTLIGQIKRSGRVKKVNLMPGIMISSSPNLTELRETAVRLQADLLVVFSAKSDIYYKFKALDKDEAKAFSTCETILMDIRTGLIPHSSVITRDKLVKKQTTDLTLDEMRRRAEKEAVLLTLSETGREIAAFLEEEN